MTTTKVKSSVIAEIGYDEETKQLEVVFANRARWQYADVPLEVYEAFIAADSVGQFFGAKIRKKYSGEICNSILQKEPSDKAGD
ncbi:MAG TPA: KTSC domain-containing protein [Bryobacteraceae bacterium]|nr:KTSC domain-containing protein [Bryobacteraceae bacterium]